MGEFIKNIIADLKRGSNLDLYITIGICLAVAVMSVLGIAKIEWVLSSILAALLVQSANFISEQRKLDGVMSKLASVSATKLIVMNDTDFAVHIMRASKINMVCVANFRLLASNAVNFIDFVRRGGRLREVLLDPTNQESVGQSSLRSVGASKSPGYTATQIQMTIDKFKEIASYQISDNQVEMKHTCYVTSVVFTWFEFPAEPGLMFVTITGFRQPTGTRLTLFLREDVDMLGYRFFSGFFENVWSWDGTKKVDW